MMNETVGDLEKAKAEIHRELGYKRLNKVWAKVEIFFGLLAVGVGISLMLTRPTWLHSYAGTEFQSIAGLALFVLGGYLMLAGNRSHIYQSINDHAAHLLRKMKE